MTQAVLPVRPAIQVFTTAGSFVQRALLGLQSSEEKRPSFFFFLIVFLFLICSFQGARGILKSNIGNFFLLNFFSLFGFFESHPAMLGGYSWFCSQELLLEPYGMPRIEPSSAAGKCPSRCTVTLAPK